MFSATRKKLSTNLNRSVLLSVITIVGSVSSTSFGAEPEGVTGSIPQSNDPLSSGKSSPEENCLRLHQKYILPLQDLWKRRGPELRAENTDGYAVIEDLSSEHCKEDEQRKELIETLARILNSHSGKIGVVLPIAKRVYLRHIVNAFEASIRANHLDPKKILVVIDNQEKDERTHQAIASLVFEHKVSAVIGGTEPRDAGILRQWATKIALPTFILSEPPNSAAQPFVYYTHPTQKSLSKAAVEANIRFGHKRVAILSPSDQHSQHFITNYVEAAKAAGITITHNVAYDPKRFDLMQSAAKKIFRLDGLERQDELKKLYETGKQYAKETGVKFNPKMVALQPDIQQDAILIPDNFKIVRHFAKIFAFLGVRKMPLFGHFEWRSTGLINPWDNFMNGSYFVDFQGAYSSLPEQIKVQTPESPYFIAPDKVEQADFSLIGWRAIQGPLLLSQKKSEFRRKLDKSIPRKTDKATEVQFDSDNTIVWNSYLFKLNGNGKTGSISLMAP